MVKAKLWFKCAAMHDPVTPTLVHTAVIGWEAKYRDVELQIERGFNGEELVQRMKGWVTTDPYEVIEEVKGYGRLRVLDERELVLEVDTMEAYESLRSALQAKFGGEIELELIPRKE